MIGPDTEPVADSLVYFGKQHLYKYDMQWGESPSMCVINVPIHCCQLLYTTVDIM